MRTPLLAAASARLRAAHTALVAAPPCVVLTGLGCLALAASSDLANTFDAPRRGGPLVALLLAGTLALAFALWLAATRQGSHTRAYHPALRLLIYPVLLWALFTAVQAPGLLGHGLATALTVTPPRYGSDDLYYNHYNALLVLHGRNPYAGPWLRDEVRYFGASAYTPIARGRFSDPHHYPTRAEMDAIVAAYVRQPQAPQPAELDPRTTHSYPAGAFLVDLPVVWAGAPSVAVGQIALLLALLALITWAAPAPWRPLVALLLLSTADGMRQVVGSDFEIWPLAFVAATWLARDRRILSALLLGCACAIKQTAWFAAPFYLLWVWRVHGRDEALRRAALAGATFLVINLPWILAAPSSWLTSTLLPVTLPLLPDGSGLVGLGLAGALPLLPSWCYAALEVAALLAALLWYWRALPRAPFAGLVLPLLPLFFAWRSSERYFVLLPLLALLALTLTLSAAQKPAHTSVCAHTPL